VSDQSGLQAAPLPALAASGADGIQRTQLSQAWGLVLVSADTAVASVICRTSRPVPRGPAPT
jgi:hypothetical protein